MYCLGVLTYLFFSNRSFKKKALQVFLVIFMFYYFAVVVFGLNALLACSPHLGKIRKNINVSLEIVFFYSCNNRQINV